MAADWREKIKSTWEVAPGLLGYLVGGLLLAGTGSCLDSRMLTGSGVLMAGICLLALVVIGFNVLYWLGVAALAHLRPGGNR